MFTVQPMIFYTRKSYKYAVQHSCATTSRGSLMFCFLGVRGEVSPLYTVS